MGAGQPLPGTPDLFEPAPEGEPVAAGGRAAGRAATTTGAFPVPGDASTERTRRAGRGRSRRAGGPGRADPPAEQTILMEPVTDEPAPEAEPVESTQAVAPPVGGAAAHDQDADDSAAGSVEAPTQVAPASPARSG